MAYFTGNIYSEELLMETQFHIILPQDGRSYVWKKKPKTLILLHGLSDNSSTWTRLSSIERYAEKYNLAVAMPEVSRSWYQDMIYGQNPFTYITEELPRRLSDLFQVSVKRDDLLIAGWSMGGYGALKCALTAPESFSCCGALSGAYDLSKILEMSKEDKAPAVMRGLEKDMQAVFGENINIPEEADIPSLIIKRRQDKEALPNIYMSSGTKDFLYPIFKDTRDMCRANVTQFYSEEFEGGHEWRVCDRAVEHMLEYFLGDEKRKDN